MQAIKPIRASEWIGFDQFHRELLKQNGGLPVNDVFFDIWGNNAKIKLLRGSRGGGKSEVAVDKLIDKCRSQKYFKCYYGRKVFDTVRGSCFATLVAAIKKMGLEHEFRFSEAENSSMIVTHRDTGNCFIPFGCDKASKLKSIKDPTHIWCEEFDAFTFEDFKELYPTLRTIRGENEFWATFNCYPVYENHWIMKVFFPNLYKGEDKLDFDVLEGASIADNLSKYTDNYFIDQEDYYRKLKLASGGSQTTLDGLANGDWGVVENKNPWLYAFDRQKQTKIDIPFLPSYPVYLSFDFNNDPFACTAWQMSPSKGTQHSFIHGIKEFSGVIKIEEMCQRIRTTFPSSILHVTGDRSGQNEDVGRNQTLYKMISGLLKIPEINMNLNSTNLEHADSRMLMNAMLASYPNVFISQAGCPNLIKQCERAKVDSESKKPSQLLKDRDMNKNDEFDSARYFFQSYFLKYAKDTFFKIKPIKINN
jgi:phage terminase large subunit